MACVTVIPTVIYPPTLCHPAYTHRKFEQPAQCGIKLVHWLSSHDFVLILTGILLFDYFSVCVCGVLAEGWLDGVACDGEYCDSSSKDDEMMAARSAYGWPCFRIFCSLNE